jgi:hypothetical protein
MPSPTPTESTHLPMAPDRRNSPHLPAPLPPWSNPTGAPYALSDPQRVHTPPDGSRPSELAWRSNEASRPPALAPDPAPAAGSRPRTSEALTIALTQAPTACYPTALYHLTPRANHRRPKPTKPRRPARSIVPARPSSGSGFRLPGPGPMAGAVGRGRWPGPLPRPERHRSPTGSLRSPRAPVRSMTQSAPRPSATTRQLGRDDPASPPPQPPTAATPWQARLRCAEPILRGSTWKVSLKSITMHSKKPPGHRRWPRSRPRQPVAGPGALKP